MSASLGRYIIVGPCVRPVHCQVAVRSTLLFHLCNCLHYISTTLTTVMLSQITRFHSDQSHPHGRPILRSRQPRLLGENSVVLWIMSAFFYRILTTLHTNPRWSPDENARLFKPQIVATWRSLNSLPGRRLRQLTREN